MMNVVKAPSWRSECKCCKRFTFPCHTSWRPDQLAQIKLTKLRHCQFMYTSHPC